jgi:hypothetical protein
MMVRARPLRKIKKLRLSKFRQVGTDINGRPQLEVYFKNKNGSSFVWTPTLHEGTLRLFQLGCQVKTTEQQSDEPKLENGKPASKYLALAIKIGKALYQKTTLEQVRKVANTIFTFDLAPRIHFTMPDIVAQEIYDWIITLSDQPIDDEQKLKLIRKFAICLNAASSPGENTPESSST